MNHRVRLAVAAGVAAACLNIPCAAVLAQTAASNQVTAVAPPSNDAAVQPPSGPAPDAAPQPTSTPADPVQAAASPVPTDQAAPAPGGAGPLVTYVKRTKPPFLVDQTIAAAELGMIGAIAAISSGHEIVTKNNILDPSTDVAHQIAVAYAALQNGQVAEAPISDDQLSPKAKPDEIGQHAGGARYVVDVAPVNMEIIYFLTDPLRRDLMMSSTSAILDTSTGKVVAKARCFIKSEKVGQRFTHDELLADQAAALKSLILQKGQECAEKMEVQMKIGSTGAAPAA